MQFNPICAALRHSPHSLHLLAVHTSSSSVQGTSIQYQLDTILKAVYTPRGVAGAHLHTGAHRAAADSANAHVAKGHVAKGHVAKAHARKDAVSPSPSVRATAASTRGVKGSGKAGGRVGGKVGGAWPTTNGKGGGRAARSTAARANM